MQKLKKGLKLTGLICLIILACFGVGISGAAPVLPRNRDNKVIEITIESTETDKEEEETISTLFKQ